MRHIRGMHYYLTAFGQHLNCKQISYSKTNMNHFWQGQTQEISN